MVSRIWQFGLAAALAIGFVSSASAGLLPLTANAVPDGDNFRYTYGVMLTSNSQLIKGDQFVIYDFNGFINGSASQPANFTFSTANVGGNVGILSVQVGRLRIDDNLLLLGPQSQGHVLGGR